MYQSYQPRESNASEEFLSSTLGSSLRKQPTFREVATWALAKRLLSNEHRNSIQMTRHYPDLGSASDWLKWNSLAFYRKCVTRDAHKSHTKKFAVWPSSPVWQFHFTKICFGITFWGSLETKLNAVAKPPPVLAHIPERVEVLSQWDRKGNIFVTLAGKKLKVFVIFAGKNIIFIALRSVCLRIPCLLRYTFFLLRIKVTFRNGSKGNFKPRKYLLFEQRLTSPALSDMFFRRARWIAAQS